jgi:hypothetical protein
VGEVKRSELVGHKRKAQGEARRTQAEAQVVEEDEISGSI